MEYDILVKQATVIDGSGAPGYVADVAVRGDRIVLIAEHPESAVTGGIAVAGGPADARAALVLDGTGKVLAPGFIDPHTHDEMNAIRQPEMLPKLSQGVTTVIGGHCGISGPLAVIRDRVPDPLSLLGEKRDFIYPTMRAYTEGFANASPALNVGTLIGHTTLRALCMDDLFRPATREEIIIMRRLLREALEDGAMGLSTGLSYKTACNAPTGEILALSEELAATGALYVTHIRSEYDGVRDALEEAAAIGRHAGAATHISHFKCAGAANWGRSEEMLAVFDELRASQDLTADCYPYAAGSSTLDLSQITEDYRIDITWSDPHPEMAGKCLAEIAGEWGLSLHDAGMRLIPAGAIYHQMDEKDVRRFLAHEAVMVCSDGLPNDPRPHPRLWGSFPRVLGHYSREMGLFPLHTAVHKMTGMPAARFCLKERGQIKTGYYADLTLFDPETVIDKAGYGNSMIRASGIEAVIVNGELAYRNGEATGKRGGRFLPWQS